MNYTRRTVADIDGLGKALESADRYDITAEILNHVLYLITNQDDWRCKSCGDVVHPCMPCDQPTVSAQTQSQKSTTDQLLHITVNQQRERIASLEAELAEVRGELYRETEAATELKEQLNRLRETTMRLDERYNRMLPLLDEKDAEAKNLRSQVERMHCMLSTYHNEEKTNV